jgi:hypothetical protein
VERAWHPEPLRDGAAAVAASAAALLAMDLSGLLDGQAGSGTLMDGRGDAPAASEWLAEARREGIDRWP